EHVASSRIPAERCPVVARPLADDPSPAGQVRDLKVPRDRMILSAHGFRTTRRPEQGTCASVGSEGLVVSTGELCDIPERLRDRGDLTRTKCRESCRACEGA